MLNRLDASMNQLLQEAGVKTIEVNGIKYLLRNGVHVKRPNVENCINVCLSVFNVII